MYAVKTETILFVSLNKRRWDDFDNLSHRKSGQRFSVTIIIAVIMIILTMNMI